MYIVIAAVLEELFCFIEQGLDLPLHHASSMGYKEIAELLISYGADPDRMDKVSQSPTNSTISLLLLALYPEIFTVFHKPPPRSTPVGNQSNSEELVGGEPITLLSVKLCFFHPSVIVNKFLCAFHISNSPQLRTSCRTCTSVKRDHAHFREVA